MSSKKINVPAKSVSRRILRQHTRRIKTRDGVREILINQGVKKPVLAHVHGMGTPLPRSPMKDVRVGLRDTGTLLKTIGQERRLQPKLRWKDVLKPQKGTTALDVLAKKRKGLDEVYKSLRPGEVLAVDFTIKTAGPMATVGEFVAVDYEGKRHSYPIEHRMSNGSLLEYIYEQRELGNPIIVFIGEAGFFPNAVIGARPAEKIMPADTIPYREEMISIQPAPTKKYPDRVAVSKGFLDVETVRYFKSMSDYEEQSEALAKKGLNVFMERTTPQTKIKDFTRRGKK